MSDRQEYHDDATRAMQATSGFTDVPAPSSGGPADTAARVEEIRREFWRQADPSQTGIWRSACELLDKVIAESLDVPSRPTLADGLREAQARALEDAARTLDAEPDADDPDPNRADARNKEAVRIIAFLRDRAAEYRVAATDDETPRETSGGFYV